MPNKELFPFDARKIAWGVIGTLGAVLLIFVAVFYLLFADPELISREMIEDVLRFKRLDGVDVALNTIAGAAFAGGRQALQLNARLGELSVPVQVIWGREDRILPVAHCQGLPDGIKVSVFDGAGHMIHMEKAAEVNELVERFISA